MEMNKTNADSRASTVPAEDRVEEPRESNQHLKSERPQDTEITSDFLIFIFNFPAISNLDTLT